MANDIFDHIGDHNEPLPEYLKHLLYFCGFTSIKLLANLNNNDIAEMEKFGRTSMVEMVPKTAEYFHIYQNDPVDFKILPGHKKLLLLTSNDLLSSKCSLIILNNKQVVFKHENQRLFSSSPNMVSKNPIFHSGNRDIFKVRPTLTSLTFVQQVNLDVHLLNVKDKTEASAVQACYMF